MQHSTSQQEDATVANQDPRRSPGLWYRDVVGRMVGWTLSARHGQQLDASTLLQAKRAVLDAAVSLLAGIPTPEGRAILAFVERRGMPGRCRVPGIASQTACAYAAYAGTALSQIHDANDGHPSGQIQRGSYHPGRVIVPAALALAQEAGLSGRELLTAVAVGYDIATGVQYPNGACPDGFGAAASAAYALALAPEAARLSLQIAGFAAPASGAQDFETNNLTAAQQSRAGIEAALLARAGYPGSYPECFASEQFDFRPPSALGHSLHQTYNKPHPSCRSTHACVDAAISLHQNVRGSLEQIRSITLRGPLSGSGPAHAVGPNRYYKTYEFSTPYCAAAALVDGTLGTRQMRTERTDDPLIQRLQAATTIILDKEPNDPSGASYGGSMEVTMADGTVHTCAIEHPLGSPENPLSDQAIADKLVAWCDYPQRDADALLDSAMQLDGPESVDAFVGVLGRLAAHESGAAK